MILLLLFLLLLLNLTNTFRDLQSVPVQGYGAVLVCLLPT